MYTFLYYVYYGITALFLAAVCWSLLRKAKPDLPLFTRIPNERMMAALVLVPLLLRLLGVK